MKPIDYLSGKNFMLIVLCLMIPVQAAPPATAVGPFVWNVAFYNNANLTGAAVLTRQDNYVGGNWGLGAPAPGVSVNNFSARWSTNAYLTGGTYRLSVRLEVGGGSPAQANLYRPPDVYQINSHDVRARFTDV